MLEFVRLKKILRMVMAVQDVQTLKQGVKLLASNLGDAAKTELVDSLGIAPSTAALWLSGDVWPKGLNFIRLLVLLFENSIATAEFRGLQPEVQILAMHIHHAENPRRTMEELSARLGYSSAKSIQRLFGGRMRLSGDKLRIASEFIESHYFDDTGSDSEPDIGCIEPIDEYQIAGLLLQLVAATRCMDGEVDIDASSAERIREQVGGVAFATLVTFLNRIGNPRSFR